MSRRRSARSSSNSSPHPLRRFVSSLVLIAVLFVGLFGIFWLLGDTFFPLKTDQNVLFITSNLDGEKAQIIVSHFSASEQRISIVRVVRTTEVEVLGGYGTYRLDKVQPLLTIDKKDPQYVKATMSWAMGLSIDQIVMLDQPLLAYNQDALVQALRSQVMRQGVHLGKAREVAKLYFFAKSVAAEQVSAHAAEVQLTSLPDTLRQTTHQGCSVAIINTTSVPKVASRLSTIFEQSELLVVRVDDSTSSISNSLLNYDSSQASCAMVAKRVQSAFPASLETVNNPEGRQESRADLVVTVGEDLGVLLAK